MELPVKGIFSKDCYDCSNNIPDLALKYTLEGVWTMKYVCKKCYESTGPEVREFMEKQKIVEVVGDFR